MSDELEWKFRVKYSPDQPRVPAGSSEGGQFTSSGGGGSETSEVVSYETHRELYKPDYEVADGYYRPDRPIKVWIQSEESHPINAWYGSAQLGAYDYTEYTATSNDILIRWPGGNFIHRGGTSPREKIVFARSKKGPFERTYGLGVGRYVPAGAMTHLGRNPPKGTPRP